MKEARYYQDQIDNAIKYKRNGEYDVAIKIYEQLYNELKDLMISSVLVGWAKTLASSGRFEEAIAKYDLAISKANQEVRNGARANVYIEQQKILKKRKKLNSNDFFQFLKSISGNQNFKMPEEVKYIQELNSIQIDELMFNSKEITNNSVTTFLLEDILNTIITKCKNLLPLFKDEIGKKLNLEEWILVYKGYIWIPIELKLEKNRYIDKNELICKIINDEGTVEQLEYLLKEDEVEIYSKFIFDLTKVAYMIKNDSGIIDFNLLNNKIHGENLTDSSLYYTNRFIMVNNLKKPEYIINGFPSFIDSKESEYNYLEEKKYLANPFLLIGFCISNFEKNKMFYLKVLLLLIIKDSGILFKSSCSLLLLDILFEEKIISESEFNDLLDVYKKESIKAQTGDQLLLSASIQFRLKKLFKKYNIEEALLEEVIILAIDKYNVTEIYNKELNDEKIYFEKNLNLISKEQQYLVEALLEKNLIKVEKILKKGISCNLIIDQNTEITPLLFAIQINNLKLIKLLIQYGVDLNTKNSKGDTALIFAIQNKKEKIVKLLLESGADPNIKNNYDTTALIYSVENNCVSIAKLLLQYGIENIDLKDRTGNTALTLAIKNKFVNIVELLSKYGPNFNIKDDNGYTFLELALLSDDYNTIKLLFKYGKNNLEIKNRHKGTLVLKASFYGDYEIVKYLLEQGATLDEKSITGATPLMVASLGGFSKIVNLLIEYNANINDQTETGETALIFAAQENHLDVVKLLLQNKINVNHQANNGVSSLIIAAIKGNKNIIKVLLDYDADLNLQVETGETALMAAVQKGYLEIVKLLIKRGALLNIKNNRNSTALTIAKYLNHTNIFYLLQNNGGLF